MMPGRMFVSGTKKSMLFHILAAAAACLGSAVPARLAAAAGVHTISYDHDCYTVDGKDIYLYSGSMHYMRCPRDLWADRLLKIKRAGFNTVQTIVPWNYHEPEEGKLDLGELDAWLSLCESMGFYVVIRPGPYICGEWDNGGFPDWLVPKRLHLRSNDRDYMGWVAAWCDRLLPLLRKHLVTQGGGIVLVQLENEYGGDAEYKRDAIRAMHRMVRERGIDVPLFTCNTPCAEDNDDPVMADVDNGVDAIPCRWATAESKVAENIRRRREAELNAPTLGADIPGGGGMWSSYVRLPPQGNYQAPPLDGRDYDVVAKTVWMEGAAQSNFYMLFGGTNFGYWAASYMSTSYWNRPPQQCPIIEPGGLTESYYAVKLIGQWLHTFGPTLVRARLCPAGAITVSGTSKKPPSVLERVNGDTAFLFVRDQQDAAQEIRLNYTDPMTGKRVTMPRNGYLALEPRGMRSLVANVPLSGMRLRYTTSEILGIGGYRAGGGGRTLVVVYGPAGSPGEVSLHCQSRPRVPGDVTQAWDEAEGTLTLDYVHGDKDRYLVVDDVELVILSRKRASTAWELPLADGNGFWVSDCYLLRDCRAADGRLEVAVDCLPGKSHVTAALPQTPKEVTVDGRAVPFGWDQPAGVLSLDVQTPPLPDVAVEFKRAKFIRDEAEADDRGTLVPQLKSLEDLGIFDKGYVRYRATFEADDSARTVLVRYFEGSAKSGRSHQTVGDPAMVFLNGRYVPEASGWHARKIAVDAADDLRPGTNTLEVILEKIGRPCGAGGWGMGEPKGLAAVSLLGGPPEKPWLKTIEGWRLEVGLDGQARGYPAPDYDATGWQQAKMGDWKKWIPGCENFDGIGWYRLEFDPALPAGWIIPLKLCLKARTDALIYLNGILVGRYNGIGWQDEFYLPECWLHANGRNVIALAVRNAGGPGGVSQAAIRPYPEFSVRHCAIHLRF